MRGYKEHNPTAAKTSSIIPCCLTVNTHLGTIPAKPSEAIEILENLSDKIIKTCQLEKPLIIALGETAAGAYIACKLSCMYMNITNYNESFSNSEKQKFVKTILEKIINQIKHIIFIKDTLSSENIIKDITESIKTIYPDKTDIKFSAASIINNTDDKTSLELSRIGIEELYLFKTKPLLQACMYDGTHYDMIAKDIGYECIKLEYSGIPNVNNCINGAEYKKICDNLAENIIKDTAFKSKSILVIGSEEFIFPAMNTAQKLEENGNSVIFQTSSSISFEVSNEKEYPFHTKFYLTSLYDKNKKAYIYNLKKYDCALIITDANLKYKQGVQNLAAAIRSRGTKIIYLASCLS